MYDINKLSKEKDELFNEIDDVSTVSGAVILETERKMKIIEKKAKENIQKLSLLL